MKRLSLVVLIGIAFLSLVFPTFAQSIPTNSQVAPSVNQDQHTFVFTLASDVISSLDCFVIGIDPQGPNYQCLTYNSQTKLYSYDTTQSGGLVGTMLSAIPVMYDIPVHTRDYTRYVASNFGFTQRSYAVTNPLGPVGGAKVGSQGTGFQQLGPLLPFWEAMRNLVYLLYVIAFIAIGVGIMLRTKMDPRTVMSIQNQIPRIVISILLVTFSYAISGILIDAMYVTIYSVYGVASRINVFDNDASRQQFLHTQDDIFGENPLDFANNIFSLVGISVSAGSEGSGVVTNLLIPREWTSSTSDNTPVLGGLRNILSIATGDIINVVKVVVVGFLGLITSAILPFIIGIAILISLFKLWFTLIKAYIIIIINVILSPFWIFLGIFPGSKVNFESWLRQLIAYLLVFPAVVLLFLFAKLLSISFGHGNSDVYFMPPLLGGLSAPQFLSNLVGFGVILIGPILLDQIISILKAPTAGAISKAVMSGTLAGANTGKKVFGRIQQSAARKPQYSGDKGGFGYRFFGDGTTAVAPGIGGYSAADLQNYGRVVRTRGTNPVSRTVNRGLGWAIETGTRGLGKQLTGKRTV